MTTLVSIGEFSRMTGLTVKALRFYHEKSLLVPARVDVGTGYRFYSVEQTETASAIRRLRELQFSISEVSAILTDVTEETNLLQFLEQKQATIASRIENDQQTQRSIKETISFIRENRSAMTYATEEIVQKTLQPMLIAAHRMQAPYKDCGQGFKKIGRAFGMKLNGKPMLLCHDSEYKEIADYETCFPIKTGESKDDVEVRELPGGQCLALIHRGPYDTISQSYQKMMTFVKEQGIEILVPSREVYIKGPGMIFKGNPKNYVTELQMVIRES